jgi:hypothetical protein
METESAAARSFGRGRRGEGNVRMKDELATILDAMRAAQAELAAYLNSAEPNAELTLAKLVGILDRREVVRATRLLRPASRPTAIPELAEAS